MHSTFRTQPLRRTKVSPQVRTRRNICRPTACPTCGGMECIERPRFFSGQLLTDADLDAAQHYVIEKNRLRNRHLVGSGVLCGLAVRCDPCDGIVNIEPGYAIDCCGNDVVVCEEASFDVIRYLETCLREEDPACNGKIKHKPTRCDDRPREYCLVVSYEEQQSRPMTVLGRGDGCSTGRCEPSRTRESFRLDLIESEDEKRERFQLGGMPGKVLACAQEIIPRMRTFSERLEEASKLSNDLPAYHAAVFDIYCDMTSFVEDLYADGPAVRCNLQAELDKEVNQFPELPANEQDREEYLRNVYTAVLRMYVRIIQYMIDCLCDAMLVPCGECNDDHSVLLACLTVCDGKVIEICNTVRHQVVSGVSMNYWLQPLYDIVHTLLVELCCEFDPATLMRRLDRRAAADVRTFNTVFMRGEAAYEMGQDFLRNLSQHFGRTAFGSIFDTRAVVAVDVYGKNAEEVRAELANANVVVVEKRAATHAEAYSSANLGSMAWNVPRGSRVEMVLDPNGKVTSLRLLEREDR
jgi:hypothetical protein